MINGVLHSETQKALSTAVFNYYNNKRNDRNLLQSKLDGYVHHHFGIEGKKLCIDVTQDEITAELQRQETAQTDKLIQLLELPTAKSINVYDGGCGRGGTIFKILDKFAYAKASGINLTEYQTQFCKDEIVKRGLSDRARVVQGDYLNTPFADKEFTHATLNEVTQYAKDLSALFKEIHRILQLEGRLAIATWCFNDEKDTANYWKFLVPICEHYAAVVHGVEEYRNAAMPYFKIVKELDFTDDLINYWELRKRWVYQSGIEQFFIDAHKANDMKYVIFILDKKG